MPAYSFDTITSAQALAYSSASDTLIFAGGVTAAQVSVFMAGGQVVVSSNGVAATFGAGFAGQTGAVFGDGSRIVIGGAGVDNLTGGAGGDNLMGGGGDDALAGGPGGDYLRGGAGDDQLQGGRDQDTLEGGVGADSFIFQQGDSGTDAPDVITDWSSDDRLSFSIGAGAYQETSAPDAGRTYANTLIAAGARYVAVQTPSGVIVYVDTAANGGSAEDAILLRGATLDDISAVNVGAISTLPTAPMAGTDPNPPTPPPPPTPPAPPPGSTNLVGTPGPDTLVGGPASEQISGGDGDDVISGGPGDDTMDGGAGTDTLTYERAAGGVEVIFGLSPQPLTGGGEGRDAYSNFERLVGGRFDDKLETYRFQSSTIQGGAGNDTIAGHNASDALFGEAGDDRVSGSGTLSGGDGADTVSATNGPTRVEGGNGDDLLIGSTVADTLVAGEGGDRLEGGFGDDVMFGEGGDDTLNGGGGRDELTGGAGADLFIVNASHSSSSAPDTIFDWDAADRLKFDNPLAVANYQEASASTYAAALALADARIASGDAAIIAVQVLGDTYVFARSLGQGANPVDVVKLAGRGLGDISLSQIVAGPAPAASAPPPPPYNSLSSGFFTGNMDLAHIRDIVGGAVLQHDTSRLQVQGDGVNLTIQGFNLTYDEDDRIVYGFTGGTVSSLTFSTAGFAGGLSGISVPATTLFQYFVNDATLDAFTTLFAGNNQITGSGGADLIRGFAGNDKISGLGGNDVIFGGTGDDQIFAGLDTTQIQGSFTTYLRGDEGNDYIVGGQGFDDANGNMGNDTITTGPGDDYCVGGKDDDLLFGDGGNDLVYGNLGNDTCDGGEGNDVVRGGQDNDIVRGGNGDDFVSGDKGDDTMTGGGGADLFHTFGDAGIDRVLDFSLEQGDRVMLDPGTQFTVAQAGDDTVISMVGGGKMTLVGIQMTSLTPGWIFGA